MHAAKAGLEKGPKLAKSKAASKPESPFSTAPARLDARVPIAKSARARRTRERKDASKLMILV